jgi:hypothetical protein
MLKNACEATQNYIKNFPESLDKHIGINLTMYLSKLANNQESMNMEFVNPTHEIFTKERIQKLSTSIEPLGKNGEKEGSNGTGTPNARFKLQQRYGKENAGLVFNLVSKYKIKSKLFIPIEIEEKINFEQNKEIHKIIFYLEDNAEIANKNKKYLAENQLTFTYKDSLDDFERYLENHKILITDLGINGRRGPAQQENGLLAIKYFTKKVPDALVIVLTGDINKDLPKQLEKVKNTYKYEIFDLEEMSEDYRFEDNNIYVFAKKELHDEIDINDLQSQQQNDILSKLKEYIKDFLETKDLNTKESLKKQRNNKIECSEAIPSGLLHAYLKRGYVVTDKYSKHNEFEILQNIYTPSNGLMAHLRHEVANKISDTIQIKEIKQISQKIEKVWDLYDTEDLDKKDAHKQRKILFYLN